MKKRCLNRRGYFFLIDSILALSILAVGIFLIFTVYINAPSREKVTVLSEDVMDFFANNKIKDVNNEYAGLGGELWNLGLITNEENTLLQQIAEFYENYELNKETNPAVAEEYLNSAKNFIEELTKNSIPQQYTFEFWIKDEILYPKNPTQAHNKSKNATNILIPSKKIAYGFSDEEFGEMFGPYPVEVMVWQKSS